MTSRDWGWSSSSYVPFKYILFDSKQRLMYCGPGLVLGLKSGYCQLAILANKSDVRSKYVIFPKIFGLPTLLLVSQPDSFVCNTRQATCWLLQGPSKRLVALRGTPVVTDNGLARSRMANLATISEAWCCGVASAFVRLEADCTTRIASVRELFL